MKKAFKWFGIVLAVFVGLVALFMAFAYGRSESALSARYADIPGTPMQAVAASDSALYARGAHLSKVLGCKSCHGENLAGQVYVDAPPFRISPPNLTTGAGGVGQHYDPDAWERALRHGVGYDHRPFYMMPSPDYANLSDADVLALVTYLDEVPPVDNALPPAVELKPLGRALMTLGVFKPVHGAIDHDRPHPVAMEEGVNAQYGAYLASLTCMGCHSPTLEGGEHPDPASPVPAPSLAAASAWSLDQFDDALRSGTTPDGRAMDPHWMPWSTFAAMTDTEVEAIHLFLQEHFGTSSDAATPATTAADME